MLPHRWQRALLAIELSLSTFLIATHALPLWQSRWIQDDAYISFRYAKHFVQGHGLVYNLGARVEGYTNFLWTLLAAFPLAIGAPDPIVFMHMLGIALWLGTYALLLRLSVRLFAEGIWSAPLASIPLLVHYSYNQWFVSGMETPLVSFLTVAAIYFLSLDPERQPRALFWASLAGVGLTMSRADGVIVMAALAMAGLILHHRPLKHPEKQRRYVLAPLAPVILIYVPFNAWRVWYYGSFYPNTYYAKAAYLTFYERGWAYLTTYLSVYSVSWFLPLFVAALVVVHGTTRRFLIAVAVCSLATGFYVVRLGGDFMEWRFLTPVTGVLYPALVVAADAIVNARWPRRGLFAGIAVVTALTLLTQRAKDAAQETIVPGQETIPLLGRYCDANVLNWPEVGKVLDSVLPPGITIATTSAGAIPFFCDRTCLDLHGLNDAEIAHIPVDPNDRGRMGHEHWLSDIGAIRERGVDIFLPWAAPKPHALALVTPPEDGKDLVSVRLPNGQYIELEILTHDGVDLAALHRDPRLVFYGDQKAVPRTEMQSLREQFAGFEAVDTFDLQDGSSHVAHEFEEIWMSGATHTPNFHTKMLTYAGPGPDVIVLDEGRIINHQARWQIDHVAADRDLVVVMRNDRTGRGVYAIDINGKPAPGELKFASGPEAWDECSLTIPAALLVDGRNEILLRRTSEVSTEIYFAWFLQKAR